MMMIRMPYIGGNYKKNMDNPMMAVIKMTLHRWQLQEKNLDMACPYFLACDYCDDESSDVLNQSCTLCSKGIVAM